MPINRKNIGRHQDILVAEFGHGDIQIIKARQNADNCTSMIVFRSNTVMPIGEVEDKWNDKLIDDMPKPEVIFKFSDPYAMSHLIMYLQQIQQDLLDKTKK